MRIKWLYSETKFLAITDHLTGLYNRRYMQKTFEREFSRAKRYSTAISIAMFDIDHFKKINDTYGHQFGDKVLAEISKSISNSLRKSDYIARYGGEELIAVLPETNKANTLIPIERIRKSIEDMDFECHGKIVKVTVSVGIATLLPKMMGESELIEAADKALYKAKETGRNKVEVYKEDF